MSSKLLMLWNSIILPNKSKTYPKKDISKLPTPKKENNYNKPKQIKCSKRLVSISIKFNCSRKISIHPLPKSLKTSIIPNYKQKDRETSRLKPIKRWKNNKNLLQRNKKDRHKKVTINQRIIFQKRKKDPKAIMWSSPESLTSKRKHLK